MSSTLTADQTADLAIGCLEDGKAEDVVHIDLQGKSSIADAMIVASGRSGRHVSSLCDQLVKALKQSGCPNVRIEGGDNPNFDWVLIDAGDILVHLFRPEVREFYNIERLWTGDSKTAQRA